MLNVRYKSRVTFSFISETLPSLQGSLQELGWALSVAHNLHSGKYSSREWTECHLYRETCMESQLWASVKHSEFRYFTLE